MSTATKPSLKVSREGIVLIKSFEGFRPRAVRDEDGRWIIGYGHSASAREGLSVGEQDAELLLQYDLIPVVRALNDVVSTVVNQHQFDALASFAISVGVDRFLASDVLQRLNEGQAGQAADALIGWPETPALDFKLRRRAAERALFVADPALPVLLADLLAAPLPPPPVEVLAPPVVRDDFRGAPGTSSGDDPPVSDPAPAQAVASRALDQSATLSASQLQRYSPYSAAVVGPLPGFPAANPSPSETDEPSYSEVIETSLVVGAEAPPSGEAEQATNPSSSPEPQPEAPPTPPPEPLTPLVSGPAVASPFPTIDPLVLTAPTEADFVESARPTWPPDQRGVAPAVEDETVLFDDEPTLSVLRHEVEPDQPRRFDWSQTGAYLIMGGLGLASCAFSAAAFRLSVEQPSPMGETTVIAWALALIGLICVGVSSWNLYVGWGKTD